MTKCGYVYEKNVMQSSDKGNRSDKDQEKLDSFNKIFNSLQNFSEAKNTKITQRVKLLIKNLFTEREKSWETTRKHHEQGLKTKQQVQKEMEDKVAKENEQRNAQRGGHGGGRRDDRQGGRDDGRKNDRDRQGHNRKRSDYQGNYNEKQVSYKAKKQ